MKKLLCILFSVSIVLALSSCGADGTNTQTEVNTTSEGTTVKEVSTTNKQGFFHFSHNFGELWKIDTDRSTNVCLCASYNESESSAVDFVLSASLYKDEGGAAKAQSIAYSVKEREDSSSDVTEKEFGGIKFYSVCFDSYENSGKRLCNMFGQTEPAADGSYYFIEIRIDNMSGDATLEKIDSDLKTLKFSF